MADGTASMDVSASYFIAVERNRLSELLEILQTFIGKTQQEALYVEVHENIEFLYVTRGTNHDPSRN